MTKSNFSAGRKRRFACDYVPKDHEARAYAQFVRQNFERADWDEIINKPCRKRRRRLAFTKRDVARAVAAHMQSGLAVQRVEIDRDGRIVIVAGQPDQTSVAPANEWDTVQ